MYINFLNPSSTLSIQLAGKLTGPFGPELHGTNPIDLLQFDCIDLETGMDGVKYVLMLRRILGLQMK